MTNADLAEAFFALAESHPPGEEHLSLLRAAYTIFDHPRELADIGRLPEAFALDSLPTLSILRSCRSVDALSAVVQRIAGPQRVRPTGVRQGFLTAAAVNKILVENSFHDHRHLRGAIHWHTQASDGAASLESMARACMRRGQSWAVVSDHTRGLACVNGLDAEGVELQRRKVALWNNRHGEDLRLMQGLEVEILDDGSLDQSRADRDGFLLIAAIHTGLNERRDQTLRLLRAIEEPGVWALAHPQARLFGRRSGVRANWEIVFRAAAEHSVLLEINGFPRRQDLDVVLLRLALSVGCQFLVASDAHHPRHLSFDTTAIALAQEAGVPRDAIVNYQQLDSVFIDRPDVPIS